MKILVNGESREVPDDTTLGGVVDGRVDSRRGVAVAVNGEVVRRAEWDGWSLREGDRVEVLGAQQGG